MKQILHINTGSVRSGAAALSFIFISLTALAQHQPADTLQTGYGNTPVSEITESTAQLKPEDLNKGLITSPEQLLAGQLAGLRVIQRGGAPGAGARMVLRSGTSIFGSNAPLVVLDGVPLDPASASDQNSYLNFINPNDIASVTLLKDAASIAVYGGRAANGVLYITTKQANRSSRLHLDYASTAGVSVLSKKANVLTANQFREMVRKELPEDEQKLGSHNTDWQDVIYRNAYSHDHNLSLSGAIAKAIPFRLSYGYLNQNGILKTSQAKRNSLALSLNPSFLQDHLHLNLYLRKVNQQERIADKGAITVARMFDPTQPVYQKNNYGGYFTYLDQDGRPSYLMANPLSLLEQQRNTEDHNILYGQAHVQYKMHFLPALSVNMRYAFRNQATDSSSFRPATMALAAGTGGSLHKNEEQVNWDQKEVYLSYDQPLQSIKSNIKVTLGASEIKKAFQERKETAYNVERKAEITSWSNSSNQAVYQSLFGQAFFSIKDRFSIETALAQSRNSHFSTEQQHELSGSVGARWDVRKERFLVGNGVLSDLSLFINYNNYKKPGQSTFEMTRLLIDANLTYEKARKWNAGFTWGLHQNKFSGDVNYFNTKASNLVTSWEIAYGNGYTGMLINNGGFRSSGLETNLRYQIISTPDLTWNIGTNLSYLHTEVSDFEKGFKYYVYSDIPDFFGNRLVLSPGNPINAFYLYEQLYDVAGKPIEKGYKKDNRGMDEKQVMGSVDPEFLFGVNSEVSYKKFSASFLVRGTTGNYVFNHAEAYQNAIYMAAHSSGYMANLSGNYAESGFKMPQLHSSYFLENASYARLEYVQFGYDFGNVWRERAALKLNATIQNAFVITKYSGQDPEVANGIDRGQYPQPRTFSVGVNLSI